MSKSLQVRGSLYQSGPILHNCSIPQALFLGQILLLLGPCNCHPPSTEVVVVVASIVVADTAVDIGYMRPHFETTAPSKTTTQVKTQAQPETATQLETEVQIGTEPVHVQSLFSPQSS